MKVFIDYDMQLNLIQSRYQYLDLSVEQAGKIYEYEQLKLIDSSRYYFSEWEEWDFELTIFKDILSEEQLRLYGDLCQQNQQRYAEQLVQQDKEQLVLLAHQEKVLAFYKTSVLPSFFERMKFFETAISSVALAKVQYLKAEYKRYLDAQKMRIIVEHMRFHKTYQPLRLKTSLLQHQCLYILPEYPLFKSQIDEPTKKIAEYLVANYAYCVEEFVDLLREKQQEIQHLHKSFYDSQMSEGGWSVAVYGQQDRYPVHENEIMTLMLLDKNMYNEDNACLSWFTSVWG